MEGEVIKYALAALVRGTNSIARCQHKAPRTTIHLPHSHDLWLNEQLPVVLVIFNLALN